MLKIQSVRSRAKYNQNIGERECRFYHELRSTWNGATSKLKSNVEKLSADFKFAGPIVEILQLY